MSSNDTQQIVKSAAAFIRQHRSLMMATTSRTSRQADPPSTASIAPHASHVPFAIGSNGELLILVSNLSKHTANLLDDGQVSAMIIENEGTTGPSDSGDSSDSSEAYDPFSRIRLMLDGIATVINKDTNAYQPSVIRMRERLGDTVDILTQLPDFHLIALQLTSATFVRGFAQAHPLSSEAISEALILATSDN